MTRDEGEGMESATRHRAGPPARRARLLPLLPSARPDVPPPPPFRSLARSLLPFARPALLLALYRALHPAHVRTRVLSTRVRAFVPHRPQ